VPRRKSASPSALAAALTRARTAKARARAYYELGVFHDRNSRESEAIPNYLAALKLGLAAKTKARALAWLASSHYKTDRPKAALKYLTQAGRSHSAPPGLHQFIARLKRRLGA
jgi:hypothetical protein